MGRVKYWMREPHYPNVGIEINSDAIRLAAIGVDKGRIRIQHLDSVELPPGSVEINPFKPNIHTIEPVAEALKTLWSRNRFKSSRICLLLQDRTALSFQIMMEQPAATEQECLDLVRFKLKKNVPFRIEEARINTWTPWGLHDPRAGSLWAIVIYDPVLKQYERLVESSIDAACDLVDLTTFDVLNFTQSQITKNALQDKDLLFVNLNRDYISLAIAQKEKLTFYRSRSLERNHGIVEEALAEIYPTHMFYLDKLGGQNLDHCFVYAPEMAEELSVEMEKRLGLSTGILSLESAFQDQIDPSNVSLGRTFVPLVGLIISRKVEFV